MTLASPQTLSLGFSFELTIIFRLTLIQGPFPEAQACIEAEKYSLASLILFLKSMKLKNFSLPLIGHLQPKSVSLGGVCACVGVRVIVATPAFMRWSKECVGVVVVAKIK